LYAALPQGWLSPGHSGRSVCTACTACTVRNRSCTAG